VHSLGRDVNVLRTDFGHGNCVNLRYFYHAGAFISSRITASRNLSFSACVARARARVEWVYYFPGFPRIVELSYLLGRAHNAATSLRSHSATATD